MKNITGDCRILPDGQSSSISTLATAVKNVNNRIRKYGLSSREILLKRDSFTNDDLHFSDNELLSFKHTQRTENHKHSEKSKGKNSVRNLKGRTHVLPLRCH